MLSKPSIAKYYYNLDGDNEISRQLATSAHEIVAILVSATGTSIAARIYDSKSGIGATQQSILIAANTGESTPFTPAQPIPFKNGIFVIIEQGGPQGGEVFILYN